MEGSAIAPAMDGGVLDGAADAFDAARIDATNIDASPGDGSPPDTALLDGAPTDGSALDAPSPDTGVMDSGALLPDFCDGADPALRFCVRFEDALVDDAPAMHSLRGSGHEFTAGHVGRALAHDSGDSVWLGDTSDLETLPFTFETWIRPTEIPTSGRMGVVDFEGSFGIFLYPGGEVACKSAEEARTSGGVTAGRWTHVACVFETDRVRIYVDGSQAASSSSSYAGGSGGGDFRFGGNAPSGDDYDGLLDEARYFSDVRTPSELAASAAR